MLTRRENRTIIQPSTSFLKCKMYTHYTQSLGSADRFLRKIVYYESCRQKWSTLLPTGKSVMQVHEMFCNNTALDRRVVQTLADRNRFRKYRARNKLFQGPVYDCLISRYSTNSGARMAGKNCRLGIPPVATRNTRRERLFDAFLVEIVRRFVLDIKL